MNSGKQYPWTEDEIEIRNKHILGPGTTFLVTQRPPLNIQERIRALTAHVNRSELEFEHMLNRMNDDEVKTLARTLQRELVNVLQVVEETT